MKSFLVFTIGLGLLQVAARAQQGAGWFNLEPPAWTIPVQEAGGAAFTQEQEPPPAPPSGGMSAQSMPQGNVADEITPEIQALADALLHDQDRIFEWVRGHIAFKLYYGVKKGAALTLLEESGNDADTCALLVALLRASGIPARYVWGYTVMPLDAGGEDWAQYLKLTRRVRDIFGFMVTLPPTEEVLYYALSGAGMSSSHILKGGAIPEGSYGVRRCCVAVPAPGSGTTYLDPSLKFHQIVLGNFSSFATSRGYDRTTLLTEAGGTEVTHGVRSLDQTKLETYLNNLAKNFTDWTLENTHTEKVVDLIGGWNQNDMSLYPDLPVAFYTGADHPVEPAADALPTSIFVSLLISLVQDGNFTLFYSCFLPELKGRNLHLWFSPTTNNGVTMTNGGLYLDDALLARENDGSGSYPVQSDVEVTVTIIHPNIDGQASFKNQSFTKTCLRHGTYALVSCSDMTEGWLRKRQAILESKMAAGILSSSREVKAEGLNILGLQWLLQTERQAALIEAMFDQPLLNHHRIGFVSDEHDGVTNKGGVSVDIPANLVTSLYGLSVDVFYAQTVMKSAMEHGVLAQLQGGVAGASTISVTAAANAAGKTLYLATNSNWSSVSPLLTGYPSSQLSRFSAMLLGNENAALIPQAGNITIGSWQGYGAAGQIITPTSLGISMEIGGQLNGGYSGVSAPLSAASLQKAKQNTASIANSAPVTHPTTKGGDPVDMASGHFMYQHTDLSIDGGALPEGVSFTRSYHGGRRLSNRDKVGHGWTHNLSFDVNERSDVDAALGTGTVAQSAASLIGLYVVTDLARHRTTAKDWAVCHLAANWLVNSLTNNTVCITAGDRILEFQRTPGGLSYTPPPGVSATLTRTAATQNGGAVTLWEMTEKNGRKLRLTREVPAQGRTLSVEIINADNTAGNIVYDGSTIVATDYLGRWIQANFGVGMSELISVQDSTGRTVNYDRDAARNLTGAYDSISHMDRLTYDNARHLTEVKTPANAVIVKNTIFDAQDRVVEQFSRGLSSRPWRYYYAPGQSIAVNPAGGVVTYLFDERLRSVGQIDEEGRTLLRSFDLNDRLFQTRSPNPYYTVREHDSKHNLKTVYDELNKTTQFEYDTSSNLTKTTDPLNNVTSFTDYTSARMPQTITRPGSVGKETYTYSGDRVQEKRVNGILISTHFYADTASPLRRPKKPWKIEYRTGTATTSGAYSTTNVETEEFTYTSRGDLHTHKDRRGLTTTFHYDERRRLWKTEAPGSLDTDPTAVTTRTFTLSDEEETATTARGYTTDFTYTVLGKLETTTLPAVGTAARLVTTQVYDLADRVSDIIAPGPRTTHFDLNEAGQVEHVTLPNNLTVGTIYDAEGRPWKVTDGLNRTTTTAYSARSEVTRVTQPDTKFISKLYDNAGRNTRITNRLGKFWTPGYDGINRLTSLKSPSPSNRTSTTVYTTGYFDLTKSPVFVQPKDTFTTPGGRKTEVLYDAAHRPVTRNLYPTPTATTPTHTLTSTFDPNGNLLTVTEGSAVLTRTYDQRNAVRTYTNALNETFVYRYDAGGNLVQLTLPGTKTITYAYDEMNRLDSITDWANRVTDFTYDPTTGDFTGYTRPNNTQRVLGHDNGGRLTRIHERTTAGRLIAMIRLGFDDAGRAEKRFLIPQPIPASFPAQSYTYTVDNWINGINHDGDGNLLQVPAVPASTSSPSVAQASIGLLAVSGSASNAVWDLRNRLQSLSLADGSTMNLTYDAENLRLTKSIGTQTTRYVHHPHGLSGMNEMTIEHKPDGRTRYYVWGGPAGLLYDVTVPAGGGAETLRYYHADQVGSIVALTDSTGTVTSRFDYTAYGLMTRREGDADTPFLYNGAHGVMTDRETGLVHMRARYYHPWMARFLSEDPIGFGGGMNWFAFANGNPVMMLDALGLDAQSSQSSMWSLLGAFLQQFTGSTGDAILQDYRNAHTSPQGQYVEDSALLLASALSLEFSGERAVASIEARLSSAANNTGKLYHYTGEANVGGILTEGLVPGRVSGKVWTTPNGTLTPLQAQIELALPANRGLPGAMLEIDAAALQRAGIQPSLGPIRVQPTPNAPGGGVETIFNQAIPPEFIRRVR